MSVNIWPRVDELVDRAATVADLHRHRLHLYAAWRWRSLGRPIPGELARLERTAAAGRMAREVVASRLRAAYDGPMVLLKGADVAAHYPRPDLRPSQDLDILVREPEHVRDRLLEHGFEEFEEWSSPAEHHHLPPLAWPGVPTAVEIHNVPNWPLWLKPPHAEELIEASTSESALGHGIRALPSAHHALVLVAHLWRDDPVGRLGPLLDAHLMASDVASDVVDDLARRWGLDGLWRTTRKAIAHVLLEANASPLGVRALTSSVESMRERKVLESRLLEAVSPFYAHSARHAVPATARNVMARLRLASDQTWQAKLRRIARELRLSLSPLSAATEHARRDTDNRRPG